MLELRPSRNELATVQAVIDGYLPYSALPPALTSVQPALVLDEEGAPLARLEADQLQQLEAPARGFPEYQQGAVALATRGGRCIGYTPTGQETNEFWQALAAAAERLRASVLLQPYLGRFDPWDVAVHRLVARLEATALPGKHIDLVALPPPSALLDAEIKKRCGCTHIVGSAAHYPALDGLELVDLPVAQGPARQPPGCVVFFTGLSGAGKSTIAKAVAREVAASLHRPVSLLDGDEVRRQLSAGLGFSREHRDMNVRRIGYVAAEVAKHGGVAICAPIAPYADIRADVRRMVEPYGTFIEVHVSTPLAVCEQRDRKGLYAKARAGEVKGVTGIDDPYEAPAVPELRLDTAVIPLADAVQAVMAHIR